jgi:hypothetical protein
VSAAAPSKILNKTSKTFPERFIDQEEDDLDSTLITQEKI